MRSISRISSERSGAPTASIIKPKKHPENPAKQCHHIDTGRIQITDFLRNNTCNRQVHHHKLSMKLKTNVTFKQYLQLMFKLTYQKIMFRILVGIAALLFLWIIFYQLDLFGLPQPIIYQYITLGLIGLVQPAIVFSTVHRNYYSSNQLRETLEMELTEDRIKIHGETFYMEILWKQIHRFSELTRWFMIYQNNLSAIIIPKRSLTTDQIHELRIVLAQAEQHCAKYHREVVV